MRDNEASSHMSTVARMCMYELSISNKVIRRLSSADFSFIPFDEVSSVINGIKKMA